VLNEEMLLFGTLDGDDVGGITNSTREVTPDFE